MNADIEEFEYLSKKNIDEMDEDDLLLYHFLIVERYFNSPFDNMLDCSDEQKEKDRARSVHGPRLVPPSETKTESCR